MHSSPQNQRTTSAVLGPGAGGVGAVRISTKNASGGGGAGAQETVCINTVGQRTGGRLTKWGAHHEASKLWPGSRTSGCCRVMTGSEISIIHHPERGAASLGGVAVCGSVWQCPVCASKISDRRRDELALGICAAKNAGLRVFLVTYTVRHKKADNLRVTVDGILQARRKQRSGRRAAAFAARWGVVGSVRALETTHGEGNGWHPHIHELLILEPGDGTEADLELELLQIWKAAVDAAGLRGVDHHGVKVQAADSAVAGYVSKFGAERSWTAAHELAKNASKGGGPGGRTPSDLLRNSAGGCSRSGFLWVEYAAAFRGRRQLHWSSGLRERLGLVVEQTDQQVAEEETAHGIELGRLTRDMWSLIVRGEWRGEVLEAARSGSCVVLWAFLQRLPGWRWGDGVGAWAAECL